jgi:hypothetical protein
MLGRAFQGTSQTFARLERRRESVQRAYHRTLQDLRQIQDSRRGALWAQPDIPAADPPEAPKPSAAPPAAPPVAPPPTPSSQKSNPEIGFVPENRSPFDSPSRETPKTAPERQNEQPQTAPKPRKDAA